MLTEYRANGTEEAKKTRWKPGMQSTGSLDIPAPPPLPRQVLYVKSLFVILLSNLNG